jgi:hypothetical protein
MIQHRRRCVLRSYFFFNERQRTPTNVSETSVKNASVSVSKLQKVETVRQAILRYRLGARAAATIRRASEIRDNRIKAPTLSDFSLIGVWSGRTTGLHFCTEEFLIPGFRRFRFLCSRRTRPNDLGYFGLELRARSSEWRKRVVRARG